MICSFFFISDNTTYSSTDTVNACSPDAVRQLGKIIYREAGAGSSAFYSESDSFYMKLTTASVVLNNASWYGRNSNGTWYEKIRDLSSNIYGSYDSYRNSQFINMVPYDEQGEILYIAQLALSGKYNVPSSIVYQAEKSVIDGSNGNAIVWDMVDTKDGFLDVYFAHSYWLTVDNTYDYMNKDVFGRTISNTSKDYFRRLASSFQLSNYSDYTVNNICKVDLGSGNVDVTPETYKVNFYVDEDLYETVTVEDGKTVNMPDNPSKDGYKFRYWTYNNGSRFYSDTEINENINLYAKWKEIIESEDDTPTDVVVEIIFDGNDGEVIGSDSKTCTISAGSDSCTISSLPSAERDGYYFKGWNTSSSCTSGKLDKINVDDNDTYYACWVSSSTGGIGQRPSDDGVKKVTITFNSNNGTLKGNKTESCDIVSGKTSCDINSLPSAERNGYVFSGWNTSKSCTSGKLDKINVNKNSTYYACWVKENTTIDTNPGTGNWLLSIAYLIGMFALGYTVYYSCRFSFLRK